MTKCKYCLKDSKAHSFKFFDKVDNYDVYYTKLSEAKLYDNPKSIKHHMEFELKKQTNNWCWIIDFNNATTKHYFAFSTVRFLSNWIKKDSKFNLLKFIYLKNTNSLVSMLLKISSYYLPTHIKVDTI